MLRFQEMEIPHTKTIVNFLKNITSKKRILFVGEEREGLQNFKKSLGNIPKVNFRSYPLINGYDLAVHGALVVFEPIMDSIIQLLNREVKA